MLLTRAAAAPSPRQCGWPDAASRGRSFGDMGAGISPYPYALIFPQDEHEQLLIERLDAAGVDVERQVEFLDFEETGGRVVARMKRSDGAVERCEAAYLAGCDGAHSAVREALSIGFPGGTYAHLFYVADVEATGAAMNGEVHAAFDETDFLAVFPLKQDGRARFVGTVKNDNDQQHDDAVVGRCRQARDRVDGPRRDARQLVLDLSRPPSCRRALPRRARVPAWRCGPHPQPGRRPGHEHRDRRRRQPRVEAGERAAPRVPIRRSSTPTSPNGSRSLDAWSPQPIAPSPR